MNSYRVTCMFQADWMNLIPAIFGDNQSKIVSSQISGNVGLFNFSEPITPNNLGPLVIIETTVETQLFL